MDPDIKDTANDSPQGNVTLVLSPVRRPWDATTGFPRAGVKLPKATVGGDSSSSTVTAGWVSLLSGRENGLRSRRAIEKPQYQFVDSRDGDFQGISRRAPPHRARQARAWKSSRMLTAGRLLEASSKCRLQTLRARRLNFARRANVSESVSTPRAAVDPWF